MTRLSTTTHLSRGDWGYDSGTLTDVTACNLDPTAWELDRRWSPKHRYTVAYRAMRLCRRCPVLDWCARQDPPQHDCVQAGRVWWRGNVYDLSAFAEGGPHD